VARAGVKNWKNEEAPRAFEVTDEIFAAVYAQADPVLRTAWTSPRQPECA
jgi:hypothetical protein